MVLCARGVYVRVGKLISPVRVESRRSNSSGEIVSVGTSGGAEVGQVTPSTTRTQRLRRTLDLLKKEVSQQMYTLICQ